MLEVGGIFGKNERELHLSLTFVNPDKVSQF